MNPETLVSMNTQARQRFSQHCHALTNRIISLQTSNEQLSGQLETLIQKKVLLIDRLKTALAR
ncbi:hypothetical protein [Spirosoma gilvum]